MAAAKIHAVAKSGFDTSGSSGLYDRARPSYPDEVIDKILLAPRSLSLKVVELGPGTGLSTRCLVSRSAALQSSSQLKDGIVRYRGYEPSEGMRKHFQSAIIDKLLPSLQKAGGEPAQTLSAASGTFTIDDGTFDGFASKAGQGENDLVLIAQAWHWCPDFDMALKEIARSLRTRGVLALLWNLEDRDAAKWVAKARDHFERFEGDAPQYRQMKWKAMYDTPSIALFDILPEVHVSRVLPATTEILHDRILSKSYLSILPEQEQKQVLAGVDRIFEEESDEQLGRKWIEKEKGIWEYPYRTDLHMFVKK